MKLIHYTNKDKTNNKVSVVELAPAGGGTSTWLVVVQAGRTRIGFIGDDTAEWLIRVHTLSVIHTAYDAMPAGLAEVERAIQK